MSTPEPDFLATHHFPADTLPREILKIVWDKFYQWDERACRTLLDELRSRRTDSSQVEYSSRSITPSGQHGASGDDVADESFDVFDYDENGNQLEGTGVLQVCIVEDEPASPRTVNHWKPNPRYFACTPLSASFYVSHEGPSSCSFPAFSDDPAFDLNSFLASHSRFSWQWDFKDPDHEMIHLETVHILHFRPQFRLTFEEIDDLKLPSLPKLRRTADSGLVWESYQRDPLLWTDYVVSLDRGEVLSLDFVAACYSNLVRSRENVFLQVQHGSRMFCPNLWCLNSSLNPCKIHNVPEIRELRPTVATTEFKQRIDPCSTSCFRLIRDDAELDDDAFNYLHWQDNDDLEMLRNVLKLAPDALPCDLAVICRKPCDQVFANRKSLFPDEDILDERCTDPPSRFTITHFADVKDANYKAWPTKPPCSHPGPCRRHVCPCFDMNYHCERNCRCAKDCNDPVRFDGKAADASDTTNRSGCLVPLTRTTLVPVEWLQGSAIRNSVLGVMLGRVVRAVAMFSPDRQVHGVFTVFTGKIQSTLRRCKNNSIQQGRFQRVLVARSKWGYGAFAAANIAQGAYIGDYVGEMENQTELDPEVVEQITNFLGLNYSFELFGQVTIDSKTAGNEMRYLNHGNDDKANCEAEVVNVHNTHHIVLQTNRKIRAGKELLLNYGETFWKDPEDRSEDWEGTRGEV